MKPINAEFAQYVEGAREAQCPAPLILHPAFDVHMNQIAGMPAVTEYSTGMHAIPLAAAMCDDVTVYGFGGPTVRETESLEPITINDMDVSNQCVAAALADDLDCSKGVATFTGSVFLLRHSCCR
jgi:hypothetical protein